MEDFMKSAGELRSQILAIRNEYEDVLVGFKEAKKQKTQAKDRYSKCIDSGSEAGMRDCLKTIRECNAVIESLPALRESFYGRISELEERYRNLMLDAKQNVQEFEVKLAEAAKDVENEKKKSSSVHKIMSGIGSLKSLIVSSGEVKSVSQDDQI